MRPIVKGNAPPEKSNGENSNLVLFSLKNIYKKLMFVTKVLVMLLSAQRMMSNVTSEPVFLFSCSAVSPPNFEKLSFSRSNLGRS